MSFNFFLLLLMTLVYIFNGYFVQAFRFYRALKNVLFPRTLSLSPSQIYDDSTAADSTQRTDGQTNGQRDEQRDVGWTVFNFILCCAWENDHVETQNCSVRAKNETCNIFPPFRCAASSRIVSFGLFMSCCSVHPFDTVRNEGKCSLIR